MIKVYSPLCILLCFSIRCFSQVNEIWPDIGFNDQDTIASYKPISQKEIEKYVLAIRLNQNIGIIGGYVSSIYHEPVDSAKIYLQINGKVIDTLFSLNGLFRTTISPAYNDSVIVISIRHPEYYLFDTTFICNTTIPIIQNINLKPKFKILLRGRVYAGTMPLEGVSVKIKQNNKEYKTTTLECFNDKENYWNCLFFGMFKQELIADNPSDSIYLTLEKEGLKPLKLGMKFGEYSGEIMDLKMKYSSRLMKKYSNDCNLKFAFPFISTQGDWFTGLSYYRLINISNFRRVALGIDANLAISTIKTNYSTFPGLGEARVDSSYLSFFIGPSVLLWLLDPDRRYFSTYAGCTFALNTNDNTFGIQPFLGTRVFLDFNKALSLEIRYVSYNLDVMHYTFNPYGNAYSYSMNEKFDELLVNIGVQVLF